MKKLIPILSLLLLSACSVAAALDGAREPDMAVIRKGSHREEIENELYKVVDTIENKDGTETVVYEYEVGNEPSAIRAGGHAVMDLMTLGLWEVVGTPIELSQGELQRVTVIYDKNDIAKSVKIRRK